MAGGAAGGFVTRAFESMLKECANKKYTNLQSAIQTYIGTRPRSVTQIFTFMHANVFCNFKFLLLRFRPVNFSTITKGIAG